MVIEKLNNVAKGFDKIRKVINIKVDGWIGDYVGWFTESIAIGLGGWRRARRELIWW